MFIWFVIVIIILCWIYYRIILNLDFMNFGIRIIKFRKMNSSYRSVEWYIIVKRIWNFQCFSRNHVTLSNFLSNSLSIIIFWIKLDSCCIKVYIVIIDWRSYVFQRVFHIKLKANCWCIFISWIPHGIFYSYTSWSPVSIFFVFWKSCCSN